MAAESGMQFMKYHLWDMDIPKATPRRNSWPPRTTSSVPGSTARST